MTPSAYDLKEFYACKTGRLIRRILRTQIMNLWPDAKGLRLMGCGYAVPFMRPFINSAERVVVQLPRALDAHHWPDEGKNQIFLSSSMDLPIETNSIDRLIVVHGLEFSDNPAEAFAEYWRVLKSTGRMIVIVPNRRGLWSRVDWTPFGYGTPFSQSQISQFLRDQGFVIEERLGALFVPPLARGVLLNTHETIEKIGQMICPSFGGLHVIEVSKQVYALTGKGQTVKAPLVPKLAPNAEPSLRLK